MAKQKWRNFHFTASEKDKTGTDGRETGEGSFIKQIVNISSLRERVGRARG